MQEIVSNVLLGGLAVISLVLVAVFVAYGLALLGVLRIIWRAFKHQEAAQRSASSNQRRGEGLGF